MALGAVGLSFKDFLTFVIIQLEVALVLEGVAALALVNRVALGVVAVDEALPVELPDGGLVLLVEC